MPRAKAFNEDLAIDRAVDCFWARGFEATSVRDLSDAMGIAGASLYNAYGDKRALFVLALERYASRSMRERVARLETRHPPKEAIEAFVAEIIERSVRDPDCKGCLLVNTALDVAPHDETIGRLVSGYIGEIRAFFHRCLEAAQRSGALPSSLDVDVVSAHLMGIVMGLRVLARMRTTPPAAKRKLLDAVARPALDLLVPPSKSATTGSRR
jgi:TetR/AcrR family transcriptional repressor of nem operon